MNAATFNRLFLFENGAGLLPMRHSLVWANTFLFTDVECSTRLWEVYPNAMRPTMDATSLSPAWSKRRALTMEHAIPEATTLESVLSLNSNRI
jgi:hypothetical protein